jgi:hypothetical protein
MKATGFCSHSDKAGYVLLFSKSTGDDVPWGGSLAQTLHFYYKHGPGLAAWDASAERGQPEILISSPGN